MFSTAAKNPADELFLALPFSHPIPDFLVVEQTTIAVTPDLQYFDNVSFDNSPYVSSVYSIFISTA